MFRFLLVPAVIAVVAYATFSHTDLPDIMTFGLALFIALCGVVIYAWAARAKRRFDGLIGS